MIFDENSRKWLRFNENRCRLVRIDPQIIKKHLFMIESRPTIEKKPNCAIGEKEKMLEKLGEEESAKADYKMRI